MKSHRGDLRLHSTETLTKHERSLYIFLVGSDKKCEKSLYKANIEANMAEWRNIIPFFIKLTLPTKKLMLFQQAEIFISPRFLLK